jgi:hypothetical protein
MVAESPNAPLCSVDATAYRQKQMAKARDKARCKSLSGLVRSVHAFRRSRAERDLALTRVPFGLKR